jgi:hypothetical protein
MSKINVRESPYSDQVSDEIKQKYARLAEDVQQLMEKHGIETYMVAVKTKPYPESPKSLYTAFISAQDDAEVAGLHFQAVSTVKQYFMAQTPTAPGGVA